MARTGALTRGITRNVVALGVVSLLTDISSELLVYVIPLYLANVLATSPALIGLIEGIAEAASSLLRLVSGAISDRVRRRRALVGLGYGTSVAAKALFLVAGAWPVVLAARLGDRVGKGIRTAPRDALIADSVDAASRGRAFGLHRAMDTAGAFAGVAIAALVVARTQGDALLLDEKTFQLLVVLALVPGVLAVMAIVVGVRDIRPAARPVGPAPAPRPPAAGRWSSFPRAFWMFVAASALFALGNSSDAFIALRSQDLGLSVRDLLAVIIAFNLVNALVAWPVGALSDRIGRRGLIGLAWGIYAAAYAGFALGVVPGVVPLLWVGYGVYYALSDGVGRALIADLVPADRRATGYGLVALVVGITVLPASLIAGVLWDAVAPGAAFWFGAACAVAAVGVLWFVRPTTGPGQAVVPGPVGP